MKDKLNITIRIADQPRWSDRFKDKTPGEILSMVTFRFAHLYFQAEARAESVDATLASLEKGLDDALLSMNPGQE